MLSPQQLPRADCGVRGPEVWSPISTAGSPLSVTFVCFAQLAPAGVRRGGSMLGWWQVVALGLGSEDLGSGGLKWIFLGMTLPIWVMKGIGE